MDGHLIEEEVHVQQEEVQGRAAVTADREGAAAAIVREWDDDGLDVAAVLDCPFVLLGTPTEIADQLRAGAARWGIETWTVFSGRDDDASLEDLGEVAQALRP